MFRREFQTEFDKALSKVRKRLEAAGGEGHAQLQQQQQQQRQVEHNAPTGDNVTSAPVAPASTATKENDADVSKQLTNGDTKQSCNSTPASDVSVPRVRSVAIPDVLLSELLIDMKDATAEVVIRNEAVESNVAIVLDRLETLERFQRDFPVRMSFHWLTVLPNIYYLFYA